MSFIIFLVVLISFVVFFYTIGLWYIGILPILLLVGLIGYYTNTVEFRIRIGDIADRNGMTIAWFIILLGLGGIVHFFGVSTVDITLALVGLNLILLILSYLVEYIDGKKAFKIGYFASIIAFFVLNFEAILSVGILQIFSHFWAMTLGIYAFIIFIVGLKTRIEKDMFYKFFMLVIGAIVLIISRSIKNAYISILVSSVFLTSIYFLIYKISLKKPLRKEAKETVSLRRILAGERITENKTASIYQEIEEVLYNFVADFPSYTKYFLESINIVLIFLIIGYYIINISNTVAIYEQLLFWLSIILFVINVAILKKLSYSSNLQKLTLFAVINFAIYISLFSAFPGSFGKIALLGILWNIASGGLIFSIPSNILKKFFSKQDYFFWLLTTALAVIANIILLGKSSISGQLVFSLIFLYVGLQGIILFYAARYTQRLEG